MQINSLNRYLLVPISKSAPKSKLRLYEGGKLLLDLDARVDFSTAETVMYYDLSPFGGCDLTVSHESGKSFGFSEKKPEFPADPVRPKLHFTAEQGWLNDPNGLVFYEGRYHIFFQHNPVGLEWGNMHWGHAVMNDFYHWEERGIALYPDEMGDMYSGSAIVDSDNLLGLKENEHDPLILFYTAAGSQREINAGRKFMQCIAYSTDGAKTFRKYAHNPVVGHIKGANRDPKVVRDPESGVYVMALYLDGDEYALLTSKTLSDWKQRQTFSLRGDNECPDFYPLRDSDGKLKWVFTGAHDCYVIGDFDPEKGFYTLSESAKFGFGRTYAAQTFSHLSGDASRIRMSWNRFTDIRSNRFNCEFGIACIIKLVGGRIHITPAIEFNELCDNYEALEGLPSHGISREITSPCEITLRLSRLEEPVNVSLFGNIIKLDAASGAITVNGCGTMPLLSNGGAVGLCIIADNGGIEIFDLDGRVFGSFAAEMNGNRLTLGGEASLDRMTVAHGLR